MNNQLRYFSYSLSLAGGISIYLFFLYGYQFHLLYHEQYQLFLYTTDYWFDTISQPGGFADYLARYLTQFYVIRGMGAFILALLLTAIQRLLSHLSLQLSNKPAYLPLTWIPSVFYWMLLCDEHMMLSGVVSLFLTLAAVQLYTQIPHARNRIFTALLFLPMLYIVAGGTFFIGSIICMLFEYRKQSLKGKQKWFLCIYILCMLLPPVIAGQFQPYSNLQLWAGGSFYRYQYLFPLSLGILWVLTALIPILFCYLPAIAEKKKALVMICMLTIVLLSGTTYGISQAADWQKEKIMAYDHYARTRQWAKIIQLADQESPTSPIPVTLLNLALCKEGQLPDRMFEYYQNGSEGLMPAFVPDFTVPMMTGEIYYHTGFINTAQRYAFEAMEAIPDYQKSARAIQRLAETNLINEEYEVAKKYLYLLQHTHFYKKWATETLQCINDERLILENPEWFELRTYRTKTDFLYSEQEKDKMLGTLLEQNLTNRIAYEYLMAYYLLTKDISHFVQYYPLGKQISYPQIPKSYQEALVYAWGLTNHDIHQVPYQVSTETKKQVVAYGQIYTTYSNAEPHLKEQFAGTYWYYLHFRK